MKHSLRLFSGLILCGIIFLFDKRSSLAQSRKPNIIFILTDDQGYGDLGVFFQNQRANLGKPFERSPYLDALAAGGAILTQQYSAAPVCAPSRASLMLGVSQGHANVRDNQFDRAIDSNYTMASTLRSIGYTTIAIGKWGLQGAEPWDKDGDLWPARPTHRGFDYFFGYMRHRDGHEHYPKESIYFKDHQPIEVWDNGKNITGGLDKCYTPDLWTAYAKKWISDYRNGGKRDQPFFMFLAYETPHAVLELPTTAYPKGGGLHGGVKWLGTPGHMINTAAGTPDTYINPEYASATYDDDHDPTTKEVPWPDTYKRYAMATRRIDYCVGDLVALLKDLKIDENTLIVFTSDNGPSIESYLPKPYVANWPTFFGSYGPFDGIKRDNWEGGIRMPVIASWPGHIAAGKQITKPSISYDWAPTFIHAAGEIAPERMDGVSLLPELIGKGNQKSSLIYNEYFVPGETPGFEEFSPNHRNRRRFQMQMMRIDSFVGVRYDIKSATDDFEIYNVVKDPKEVDNLALHPLLPVLLKDSNEIMNHVKTVGDLQDFFKNRVLQVRRPERWAKRPYDTSMVPAVTSLNLEKGIQWRVFKGDYPWIRQIEGLKPSKIGHSSNIDPAMLKTHAQCLAVYDGFIKVPKDGQYEFYMTSSSKAFFRLHDMQLIDEDFGYIIGSEKTARVFLQAGLHPFRLFCQQNSKDAANVKLEWSGPGINKQAISANVLWRAK